MAAEKIRPAQGGPKGKSESRREAERYVLQEIETFDFNAIKYFGGHKACCQFIRKLQQKLKTNK
jgi:hypothetical protein